MLTTLVALSLLAPAPASHAPAAAPPSGIVFIEDDYQKALARARAEKKPLFLDSWATWCHSCLSMRSFVFPDAGLRPAKDAVVWLSVETEAEKNRAATVVAETVNFVPEVGETAQTALYKVNQRLAAQIVDMMEQPWFTDADLK